MTAGSESSPRRRSRGIKRRGEILDATLRILARDGTAAITHQAVADEARVALAATTYYFNSKEHLLEEAFQRHADNEARRVAEATHTLGGAPTVERLADQLAEFVDHGLTTGRMNLLAEYELLLQAARRPHLEPLSRVFYQVFADELERALTSIGSRDPRGDTRILLAAMAGLEIDNLSTPTTSLHVAELRSLIRRLLGALLAPTPSTSVPTSSASEASWRPVSNTSKNKRSG